MSIAKRFAEIALARFQKKEPETPEYQLEYKAACERIVAQMSEGLDVTWITNEEAYELGQQMASDEDYQRSLRDD